MAITLRCAATGDLLLLQDAAKALLGLLGKDFSAPGILEPADMPRALGLLRALPAESPQSKSDEATQDDAQDEVVVPFADEAVPLGKRAWALIQMIERAMAAGKPIVWGV
jgi:hypothetical protein